MEKSTAWYEIQNYHLESSIFEDIILKFSSLFELWRDEWLSSSITVLYFVISLLVSQHYYFLSKMIRERKDEIYAFRFFI